MSPNIEEVGGRRSEVEGKKLTSWHLEKLTKGIQRADVRGRRSGNRLPPQIPIDNQRRLDSGDS